jgi:hypothetical protein
MDLPSSTMCRQPASPTLLGVRMAKNKPIGDNARVGAVRRRSQVFNPQNQTWTKRDAETGRFMDQKADTDPFKGVRKEKK